jgi:copper chaperone CopZ
LFITYLKSPKKRLSMEKLKLVVEGMHCKSCEMLIADSLMDLGASKVEASSQKNEVIVEFEKSKITADRIIKAIEKEEYKVKK